jgi:hypothetical protein
MYIGEQSDPAGTGSDYHCSLANLHFHELLQDPTKPY